MNPHETGEFKIDMDAMKRKKGEDRRKLFWHRVGLIAGLVYAPAYIVVAVTTSAFATYKAYVFEVDPGLSILHHGNEGFAILTFFLVAATWTALLIWWYDYGRHIFKKVRADWNP